MKKFHYPFYYKISFNEKKQYFNNLSKVGKKNHIINSFLKYLLIFVLIFWLIVFFLLAKYNFLFISNKILSQIVTVICWIAFIPAPIAITIFHYSFLKRFIHPVSIRRLEKEIIAQITIPLRKYYKVPKDDYVVTKCYNSTNKEMINQDVLLFFNENKLRITNNFYYSIRDFGCIEFTNTEVTVYNKPKDNKKGVKTIIQSEHFQLELGYRARTFIMKHWSNINTSDIKNQVKR